MHSITDILRRFKQNWTEELAPHAIAQACRDAGMKWYESTLNPVVTIQIFFVQILHGNTACEHLTHLTGLSFTAAAYCKARMRVPLAALHLLLARCVDELQQDAFAAARWLGHRVFHVDGSSFSMPDTPELAGPFWPTGAAAARLRLSHRALAGPAARGDWHDRQDAGRALANARHVWRCRTAPGIARRRRRWSRTAASVPTPIWSCYGSVGCTVCCEFISARLSISRRAEPMCILVAGRTMRKQGKPRSRWIEQLGANDQIVEWFKSAQPTPVDERTAVCSAACFPRGSRTALHHSRERLSTQPDHARDDAARRPSVTRFADLAKLYQQRWEIETNFAHLKTTMKMDVLKCKTVDGVLRELADVRPDLQHGSSGDAGRSSPARRGRASHQLHRCAALAAVGFARRRFAELGRQPPPPQPHRTTRPQAPTQRISP